MSNLVGGLLAAVVLGVGYGLYQFASYPCRPTEWRFAFGAEYAPQRRALEAAGAAVKHIKRQRFKTDSALRARKQEITASRDRKVRKQEAEISRLRREEDGEVIDRLGPLRLHEHSLVFLAEKDTREEQEATTEVVKKLRLTQIETPGVKPGGQYTFITLQDSNGLRESAEYPHGQYDEREVHRFEERLHNQIPPAKEDLARRQETIRERQAQIEQIRANADEQLRTVEEEEQDLVKTRQEDEELRRAERDREEQRQRWKEMTGFRPWW
ncbi:hypothetical protein [Streptomyces sp. NPDC058861]|uniref:hypothetical protein n=1 Tax=Streptomyces sp. NPDC058861 TaxID=3346653 RepID=UPI0036B44E02